MNIRLFRVDQVALLTTDYNFRCEKLQGLGPDDKRGAIKKASRKEARNHH